MTDDEKASPKVVAGTSWDLLKHLIGGTRTIILRPESTVVISFTVIALSIYPHKYPQL